MPGRCVICHEIYIVGEEHHAIPQAYGGKEGPTIKICPKCHTTLHSCAINKVSEDTWLSTLTPKSREIAKKLITSIRVAKESGRKSETVELKVIIERRLYEKIKLFCKDRNLTMQETLNGIISKAFGG